MIGACLPSRQLVLMLHDTLAQVTARRLECDCIHPDGFAIERASGKSTCGSHEVVVVVVVGLCQNRPRAFVLVNCNNFKIL